MDIERYAIKNGWAARCPNLRIAAHGSTPAEAEDELTYLLALVRVLRQEQERQRRAQRTAVIAEAFHLEAQP